MNWNRRIDVGLRTPGRVGRIPVAAESSTGAPEFAWDEIDGSGDALDPVNAPSAGAGRIEFPSFVRAAIIDYRLLAMRPPRSWIDSGTGP